MAEYCAFLGKAGQMVIRFRFSILSFWLLTLIIASFGAVRFLSICEIAFNPPKSSAGFRDDAHVQAVMPGVAVTTSFVALLETHAPTKVLELANTVNFSFALLRELNSTGLLSNFVSNSTLWYNSGVMGENALSKNDGTALLFQWDLAMNPTNHEVRRFSKQGEATWNRLVAQWLRPGRSEAVDAVTDPIAFSGVLSLSAIVDAGLEDSERSLEAMDAISMPLAMIVLSFILKSARLLVLPLAAVATAASTSFGIMYCVGRVTEVEQTTPSLMMTLMIAMSIDYALFLLTRFKDVLKALALSHPGTAPKELVARAVVKMMQTAGFTVFTSGFTLMSTFVVLACFPIRIISSLGVGCTISLFVTLIVNLTLLPAGLAAFPEFFAKCIAPGMGRLGQATRILARPLRIAGVEAESEANGESCTKPYWKAVARITTSPKLNVLVLIVVTACTLAAGCACLRIKQSDVVLMSLPTSSAPYRTEERLLATFGAGQLAPFKLLFEPLGPTGQRDAVLNESFWESSQLAIHDLASGLASFGVDISDFAFPSVASGLDLPLPTILQCMDDMQFKKENLDFCNSVVYQLNTLTSSDRSSFYGLLVTQFDPFGEQGQSFLTALRDLCSTMPGNRGLVITITGTAADALDLISGVYAIFPYAIATTLLMSLLLLGIAFRSVLMPLRSVATICLTLIFVFGLAVRIYQDGILDFLGRATITSKFHSQFWLMPVVSFSFVVGICLDYEIFLFSRATELRAEGMDPLSATRQALVDTGGIITAAGIIMAIAFGGLLFSDLLALCALSSLLVSAVLFDTFVMRILLTPASMSLLGRYNWWPSSLSVDEGCCQNQQAIEL